jgi:DNA modification methylase
MPEFKVYLTDVFEALHQIESESIDTVITSPPYWGLRNYGINGQIGLEEHPQQYIEKIVSVFGEVKHVLKPSGSVWLNLGDTYFAKREKDGCRDDYYGTGREHGHPGVMKIDGSNWLQPKQKMLMPHRIAIALQDAGWIVRNDCVWYKPSHMPSSVQDRLTNSFEFVFHLVKSRRYFYDLDAIREPHAINSIKRMESPFFNSKTKQAGVDWSIRPKDALNPAGKNPSDFWEINPEPYREAHFACFPTELIRRPLLATCPKQVCKRCRKARERIFDGHSAYRMNIRIRDVSKGRLKSQMHKATEEEIKNYKEEIIEPTRKTIGWTFPCSCNAGFEPGIVLDPFVGSGTTLQVAQELGLNGIGIELQANYTNMIMRRLNCKTKIGRNKFSNPISTLEFVSEKEIEYEPRKQKNFDEKQATI